MADFAKLRRRMMEDHIAARGVRSKLVLDAMGEVQREAFLPARCGSSPPLGMVSASVGCLSSKVC
jgi:hypothetical protein